MIWVIGQFFLVVESSHGLLSPGAWETVRRGGVHVERDFVPAELTSRLRKDADSLQRKHLFTADGLTNTVASSQGFSKKDRQTLRGNAWFDTALGNAKAREDMSTLLSSLRSEATRSLQRPLAGFEYDETSYNYYAPGASLALHLDEHHEESKALNGWRLPSRRSLTWLIYLNQQHLGGQLRCFIVDQCSHSVGAAANGDLQVAWRRNKRNSFEPVFLGDELSFSAKTDLKLYTPDNQILARIARPFSQYDLPSTLLPISTRNSDARFYTTSSSSSNRNPSDTSPHLPNDSSFWIPPGHRTIDIEPAAGTLVLFDSVVVPHQVLPVEQFPRLAATGWFHELLPLPVVS